MDELLLLFLQTNLLLEKNNNFQMFDPPENSYVESFVEINYKQKIPLN